jgi:hypothetical protein
MKAVSPSGRIVYRGAAVTLAGSEILKRADPGACPV